MGTIAQKLEYLNDTRLLLKDNINKINNVLDDNSTFRSYPQELFNGYLDILNNGTDTLWSNLEKVSQTGTEAVLEGVETAPMKMVLNGNTSQDGEPTPDTPVEVKVVKGENVVSISGENQSDKTDYPINLGDIELCKINTYKDFPFKAINGNEYYDTLTDEQKNALNYGSWYVHKAIGKKVVTSSEILGQTDSYSNVIYYKFNKNTDSINYNNYNSMVAFYTHAKISNSFNFDSLSQVSTINSLAENTRYWVGFPKGTTLAQAKEKLVGSVLYYILKTPTETEITNSTLIEQLEAISKAKSVKDKTYITQTNDDLPFILDVEAIKEYEVN